MLWTFNAARRWGAYHDVTSLFKFNFCMDVVYVMGEPHLHANEATPKHASLVCTDKRYTNNTIPSPRKAPALGKHKGGLPSILSGTAVSTQLPGLALRFLHWWACALWHVRDSTWPMQVACVGQSGVVDCPAKVSNEGFTIFEVDGQFFFVMAEAAA